MTTLDLSQISQAGASLQIGATGMTAITQNIRVIVTTLAYSVPLDRGFSNQGSFIDAPTPHAVASRVAELTEAIEAKEPRVKVERIDYVQRAEDAMQGRVYPCIHFSLRPGVTV